ncbi:unnamed protein product, partial [Phaeothamnion confervicola]
QVQLVVNDELSVGPEPIALNVLYEDDSIIAVSKAAGMVVHPAPGNWNGTFVNALLHHLDRQNSAGGGSGGGGISGGFSGGSGGNDRLRAGVVHRLDKGTTGVLLAAKSQSMQAKLSRLFAERRVRKSYVVVCVGNSGGGADAGPDGAVIDVPIGRHPIHRQKMCAVPVGMVAGTGTRPARSVVRTAAFDGRLSVAEVAIETGRTHQIRVHMQHRRTPVAGDDLYGNGDWNRRVAQRFGLARPLLHAHSMSFEHPDTGRLISIMAPLPADLLAVVRSIYPEVDTERPAWI